MDVTTARHRNVKSAEDGRNVNENGVTPVSRPVDSRTPRCSWDYVEYSRLPAFLHDNEFLVQRHRPELNSVIECLKSAFMLHSETWNIWTHVFGALVTVLVSCYYVYYIADKLGHRLSFSVFFLGAVFCMVLSSVYHALICHSEPICKLFAKLDYCGVIILIVTSHIPWLHFVFYCDLVTQLSYIIGFLAVGGLSVCFVIRDEFRHPSYRWIRFLLFAILGLGSIVPVTHSVVIHDILSIVDVPHWLPFMAGLYLLGGLTYAVRFPERLCPGLFDVWCQSHQIMHVCVVGGVMSCYKGAADLAVQRLNIAADCQNSTAAFF